jgi:SAM-dependent methyltransferase
MRPPWHIHGMPPNDFKLTISTAETRRTQRWEESRVPFLCDLSVPAVKSFGIGVPMSFTADPSASRIRNSCPICDSPNPYLFCSVIDRVRNIPDEQWRISRCRRCGFGWTEPLLSENEIPGYYPTTYFGEIEQRIEQYLSGAFQRSRSWRGETEKARLVETYISGGRLLDVGCGDAKFLWALNPDRWQRAGVERSVDTVELVRQRIPGIELHAGDIFNPALKSGTFDVVTFWHVLEHLPDPARALDCAASLLRPGGLIIISLPSIDSLQASLFRRHWYGFDDVPRHLHHHSHDSLNLLLDRCGLDVKHHLMFSRLINFHALKHSLLNWLTSLWAGRILYYALKPFLFGIQLLERISGRYGIRTVIATKKLASVSN